MYHASIDYDAICDVAVERHSGICDQIDGLADMLPTTHRFLRAAWFGSSECDDAATLIASRIDGTRFAALPTIGVGPSLIGARAVPGSYWPFRSMPLAPDATHAELKAFLEHPLTIQSLGHIWRLGPIYADDPATRALKQAAASAGWTVLVRRLGHTFLFDTAGGWPRSSTRRRLANYSRQLDQQGSVRYEVIRGTDWNDAVLDDLAAIEQASWVGHATDGTGAKFLSAERRADWRRVLADPVLADALTATILRVDERPVAFSFDLIAAPMQYGIASSYDDDFAAFRPGKLVTAHQIGIARSLGVERIDFGAGDSGYKREMGAALGPEILDLLIVRHRSAASLLKMKWGSESEIAREAYRAANAVRDAGREGAGRRRIEAWLTMGALAAAAISFAE